MGPSGYRASSAFPKRENPRKCILGEYTCAGLRNLQKHGAAGGGVLRSRSLRPCRAAGPGEKNDRFGGPSRRCLARP